MSRIKIARRVLDEQRAKLRANFPDDYSTLFKESDEVIKQLTQPYTRTAQMYAMLTRDAAVDAHWNMANYTTVMKLNYNDHGPIHARVSCAYAMQMLTHLVEAGIPLDVVESGAGELDDAFLVVLTGILLHDIGNSLHRSNHEAMGVILAQHVLERVLPKIYSDEEQYALVSNFILSMVQCHDMNPVPLFMEGAIVAVSDGCDMTKGRARMPFDLGKIDIHAVSALSIEDVNILKGHDMPVEIEVLMSNSAGIFQVEQTLVTKLNQTPLKKYVTVTARTINVVEGDHHDKRIVDVLRLRDGRLTPNS